MLVYRDIISSNIDNKSYINYSLVKDKENNYDEYSECYFTIKCISETSNDAHIHFISNLATGTYKGYPLQKHLYYRLGEKDYWKDYQHLTGIYLAPGSICEFKANFNPTVDNSYITIEAKNCNIEIYGNIMSLLYGDDFKDKHALNSYRQFAGMFKDCTGLSSINNLVLPATVLTNECYSEMFSGCTNLTLTKNKNLLPANILFDNCYYRMFYNCSSMTHTPSLPGTELAIACYKEMFYNCSSLRNAMKSLNAETIQDSAYYSMFYNCTSLEIPPNIKATKVNKNACRAMFYNCISLTSCPELNAIYIGEHCYNNMFRSCKKITKTCSNLPATTLYNGCYTRMFSECTLLEECCELPALNVPLEAYQYMFSGTSLKNGPQLPATTIGEGAYYGMFNQCTKMKTCTSTLPATVLPDTCYRNMFQGCNLLTVLPNITCTSIGFESCRHMFDGCISVEYGPDLKLSKLNINSCAYMFRGCTSLVRLKLICPDISADSCLYGWLTDINTSGVLYRNDGINPSKPSNWIVYTESN